MNKCFVVMLALMVSGCAEKTLEAVVTAKNGHSVVSLLQEASECECASSGSRLNMYLDTDDSLTVTENDTFLNSLVVCNGANGLNGLQGEPGAQGPQGLQGEVGPQGLQGESGPMGPAGPAGPQGLTGPAGASASIVDYSGNSCTRIGSTSTYVKKSGSNFKLYSSSSCHSSSKVAEVSQGESYWASATSLAVHANNVLRVITFN